MKTLLLSIVALSFSTFVSGQEAAAPEAPKKPTPEFRALFTNPPPVGAPAFESWEGFAEYTEEFTLQDPAASNVLGAQAVATGVCAAGSPCTFTLYAFIASNNNQEDLNLVVRYLLVKADGTRAEGFADAKPRKSEFHYFHAKDGPAGRVWARVAEGSDGYTLENSFVSATWGYVQSRAREQEQQ